RVTISGTRYKTFELLPVFLSRKFQRHWREAAKAADRHVGIVLLILRERQKRFVGVTRKRVGRRQQRVCADSIRIRIEGCAQRSHRLLVAPQQDESMSLTVQPGPPRGVARAKPVSLRKPVEGSQWIAEIQRREADLLVGPRLTRILGDHCFCGSDALFELTLRPAQSSACLQRDKVARLDCQRAREQLLGLEQPLLVPGWVITVEHFEYERGRDAGQSVDVLRL